MLIRNKNGKIIEFNSKKYKNDVEKYRNLWIIRYDIHFAKNEESFNKNLIDYIVGIKNYV
jgi:hypothetical protein